MLPPGSLRLADLGYFSLKTLEKLSEANVFWITRLKVRCSLFDATGEPFCLQKWLKTNTADTFETDITIGKTTRLKARLVAQKLSEQETQKTPQRYQAPCKTEKYHAFKGTTPTRRMEYLYHKCRSRYTHPRTNNGYRTRPMAD